MLYVLFLVCVCACVSVGVLSARIGETRRQRGKQRRTASLTCPLVLLSDRLLLLGGEVILDVEQLADLLSCLALHHAGDLQARKTKPNNNNTQQTGGEKADNTEIQ